MYESFEVAWSVVAKACILNGSIHLLAREMITVSFSGIKEEFQGTN